jgi:glycosyltransferase involved in cell wall biosynthesis
MKVLFVSEYWKPRVMGGGEISGNLLAASLAAKGLDVSVLTSAFPGLPAYEVLDGVKVYRRLSTGTNPQSPASNLRRALFFTRSVERELPRLDAEENFDVIHSLNITSLVGVSRVRKAINKPCVAHINSPTPFCPRGLFLKGDKECDEPSCDYASFKRCLKSYGSVSRMNTPAYLRYNPLFKYLVYRNYQKRKEALRNFERYIPISSFIKKLLVRGGIPEGKAEVIPNIVETEKFFNLLVEYHVVPRILYLGQYSEYKGPQILLSALKGLDEKYECGFYGKGPMKEEMIKYVKDNGLPSVWINDEVPQSQVSELYGNYDIVVFPSLVSEAFGRVPVEALASGKPVCASRLGGVTDIVDEGKNGLFFAPGDHAGLRDALRRLITDPALRERMGEAGRKKVAQNYTADAVTGRVIKLYEKLAGGDSMMRKRSVGDSLIP